MSIGQLSTVVGLVASIGGGGYWIATEVPHMDQFQLVAVKADYALSIQMDSTIARIALLEAKKNKTKEEWDQLQYLREELKRAREIRK
jgi:hypothetical protein